MVTVLNYSNGFAFGARLYGLSVDFERVYWEGVDKNSQLALRAIRDLIDYFEGMKRELVLQVTKLSTDEAFEFLGPATEVAVSGLIHAIDYLSVCRNQINETDLTLAKRFLAGSTVE